MAEQNNPAMAAAEEHSPWTHPGQSAATDDVWHEHTADEAPPQEAHGETSPAAIAIVGVGSFVVLLLLIGVVAVFFSQRVESVVIEQTERIDVGAGVVESKAREMQTLSEYSWVNAQKGVVSIPIEKAIEKVARELREQR